MPKEAKKRLKRLNYYVTEAPRHKRLERPIDGHVDMMMFQHGRGIIYEPRLENIAGLLRQNGYECVKGERIKSSRYPKDIIYNACSIGEHIIHYKGRIEKRIRNIKAKHILLNQGYAKCSIIPVDKSHIITSDRGVKDAWEKKGKSALLIRPGHVKLPGYKTGFIGGATGVSEKCVFFVGTLDSHPDGSAMRNFIKKRKKGIIELYKGSLYDVGTLYIFKA